MGAKWNMALCDTAALIIFKLLKKKRVHADNQVNFLPTNEVLKR
jgi:hypothetical protein